MPKEIQWMKLEILLTGLKYTGRVRGKQENNRTRCFEQRTYTQQLRSIVLNWGFEGGVFILRWRGSLGVLYDEGLDGRGSNLKFFLFFGLSVFK